MTPEQISLTKVIILNPNQRKKGQVKKTPQWEKKKSLNKQQKGKTPLNGPRCSWWFSPRWTNSSGPPGETRPDEPPQPAPLNGTQISQQNFHKNAATYRTDSSELFPPSCRL